jgi:hypothetical protein
VAAPIAPREPDSVAENWQSSSHNGSFAPATVPDPVDSQVVVSDVCSTIARVVKSVCAMGRTVTFYWRGSVAGLHLDSAVEALMGAIRRADRYTGNPWLDADNEAMFRTRLNLAQRGGLKPGEDVVAVRMSTGLNMSEIRWTDVVAIPVNPVSGMLGQRVDNLQVRLYYVEEGRRWVVGLLVHEKDTSGTQDEIDARQDEWIRQAVVVALDGAEDRWGVPELGCRL